MNPMGRARPALLVRLQGGIGNQLFQYAFSRYLMSNADCDVHYLTDSFLSDPYGRKDVVQRIDPGGVRTCLADLDAPNTRMLNESNLLGPLDPSLLVAMLHDNNISACALDGYWQDLNYISVELVEWLNRRLSVIFPDEGGEVGNVLRAIAEAENSIAVHVRRHDYKHHGICNESYYIECLQWMLATTNNPEIYVFSDEPNYTSHFLRDAGIPHKLVATGDDLKDLYAMSICKRHVIANSSFSWWGATLARSSSTVYPKPWSFVHIPSETLFPANWIPVLGAVEKHVSLRSYREQLER